MQLRYWLVMPAAGSSQRFRADHPKQYAPLEGRTVIEWALAPFLEDPRCAGVVLALSPRDTGWSQLVQGRPQLLAVTVVPGGAQRSLSVRQALRALDGRAQAADWVLVHDAARPCLARQDLERLLALLGSDTLGGILAQPATDTLKRARFNPGETAAAEVGQTVDRSGLWRALTPQMFRYGRLCTALDAAHAAGRFPTDEAQALEWLGEQPTLVEGSSGNVKITSSEDLVIAAAILRARHG